jgi:hypothetical protein
MLILECSQGCYGRTDGSVTISLRNFVGEGIKSHFAAGALGDGIHFDIFVVYQFHPGT